MRLNKPHKLISLHHRITPGEPDSRILDNILLSLVLILLVGVTDLVLVLVRN
jgi:hypothetical protein